MNKNIESRVLQETFYILETKGTVRSISKIFGLSKSTIHYDLSRRLKTLNMELYKEVNKLFRINFNQRHIRGGESTRKYYLRKKTINCKV